MCGGSRGGCCGHVMDLSWTCGKTGSWNLAAGEELYVGVQMESFKLELQPRSRSGHGVGDGNYSFGDLGVSLMVAMLELRL